MESGVERAMMVQQLLVACYIDVWSSQMVTSGVHLPVLVT